MKHEHNFITGKSGKIATCSCGQWKHVNLSPEDTIVNVSPWDALAKHLATRSAEICQDNKCTEDQHNCESYAYVTANADLLDLCGPDYFQGTSKPYAAISLPWTGSGDELRAQVEQDIIDNQE